MTSTERRTSISILALFPILLLRQGDAPRQRTALPNGTLVFAERVPNSPTVSVALWASAKNCPETPQTNGYRHMLEHFMARGPQKDIDRKLESLGGYLTAKTLREATQFSMTVPKENLEVALSAVFDILSPPAVTREQIANEAKIIREEQAILEPGRFWSQRAWLKVGQLDTGGEYDTLSSASLDGLLETYRRQFTSENLVLAIAGDLPLDSMTAAGTKIMQVMPHREPKTKLAVNVANATVAPVVATSGAAFSIEVPAFDTSQAAYGLCAGLAIAGEAGHCFAYYTPSGNHSLVIVGTNQDAAPLRTAIFKAKAPLLLLRAKQLGKQWVNRQLTDPEGVVDLRGMLLCLRRDMSAESMLEAIDRMTVNDLEAALVKFQAPDAEVAK